MLFRDILLSINSHFSWLKNCGYSKWKFSQKAHEGHFFCSKEGLIIDLWAEATLNSPIWIKINAQYVDDRKIGELADLNSERFNLYKEIWSIYLEDNASSTYEEINNLYKLRGRDINDQYIKIISKALKNNELICRGICDTNLIKKNNYRSYKPKLYQLIYPEESDGLEYDVVQDFSTKEECLEIVSTIDVETWKIIDSNGVIVESSKG